MRARRARSDISQEWRDHAACKSVPYSTFFPTDPRFYVLDTPGNPGFYCSNCPVVHECLEYALAAEERHGIWGGTNEQERIRMIDSRTTAKRAAMRLARLQRKVVG